MINRLILCFTVFLLFSCEKEDVEPSFNDVNLEGSLWTGEILLKGEKYAVPTKINLEFETKDSGSYTLHSNDDKVSDKYSTYSPLKYYKEENIITIEGGYNNVLLGKWWFVNYNRDTLTLTRNLSSFNQSDSLKIYKTL